MRCAIALPSSTVLIVRRRREVRRRSEPAVPLASRPTNLKLISSPVKESSNNLSIGQCGDAKKTLTSGRDESPGGRRTCEGERSEEVLVVQACDRVIEEMRVIACRCDTHNGLMQENLSVMYFTEVRYERLDAHLGLFYRGVRHP